MNYDPLFWFVPGAPGVHVVSVLCVALLAAFSFERFGLRGILIPALVVVYSETQFQLVIFGVFHVYVLNDVVIFTPFVILLYARWIGKVPFLMLMSGYVILLVDVIDGFRVSYGFPAGSPNVGDSWTNAKEIVAWGVVCLAAWKDANR